MILGNEKLDCLRNSDGVFRTNIVFQVGMVPFLMNHATSTCGRR
jgi:hypothetical protein